MKKSIIMMVAVCAMGVAANGQIIRTGSSVINTTTTAAPPKTSMWYFGASVGPCEFEVDYVELRDYRYMANVGYMHSFANTDFDDEVVLFLGGNLSVGAGEDMGFSVGLEPFVGVRYGEGWLKADCRVAFGFEYFPDIVGAYEVYYDSYGYYPDADNSQTRWPLSLQVGVWFGNHVNLAAIARGGFGGNYHISLTFAF